MTKQLMTWARSVSGMGKRGGGTEFSSQAALQSYMRQHPKADASKHTVAQPKQASTSTEQATTAKQPRPGIDIPKPGGLPKEVAHHKATESQVERYREVFKTNEKLLKTAAGEQKRIREHLRDADKAEKAGNTRKAEFLRSQATFCAENYDAAMRATSRAAPAAPAVQAQQKSSKITTSLPESLSRAKATPEMMAKIEAERAKPGSNPSVLKAMYAKEAIRAEKLADRFKAAGNTRMESEMRATAQHMAALHEGWSRGSSEQNRSASPALSSSQTAAPEPSRIQPLAGPVATATPRQTAARDSAHRDELKSEIGAILHDHGDEYGWHSVPSVREVMDELADSARNSGFRYDSKLAREVAEEKVREAEASVRRMRSRGYRED